MANQAKGAKAQLMRGGSSEDSPGVSYCHQDRWQKERSLVGSVPGRQMMVGLRRVEFKAMMEYTRQ